MDYMSEWQAEPEGDLVAIDTVRAPGAASTLALGEGRRECDGRRVTFAGDWRPMMQIARAIEAGETPVARVPRYAVLSVAPDRPVA